MPLTDVPGVTRTDKPTQVAAHMQCCRKPGITWPHAIARVLRCKCYSPAPSVGVRRSGPPSGQICLRLYLSKVSEFVWPLNHSKSLKGLLRPLLYNTPSLEVQEHTYFRLMNRFYNQCPLAPSILPMFLSLYILSHFSHLQPPYL